MELVFHGQEARQHHRSTTDNTRLDIVHAHLVAYKVEKTADDTGQCIDFLAEDEWHLVDEHIAEHTAARTGEGAHDDGGPEGEARRDGLLNARHGEQGQTDGVEEKPRVVLAH